MIHSTQLALFLTAILKSIHDGLENIANDPALSNPEAHFLRMIDAALRSSDPLGEIKKRAG